ncbi:MAG: DMT family transporter [Candidatus Zixiibacteriota bacterium]|nr:MAG: DMT family transporter [candidate division Zixibacteria bacterium]
MNMLRRIMNPLLTGLAFSGSFVAAKYTTSDLTPLVTTLLRYVIAVIFFGIIMATKRDNFRIKPRHLLAFVALGLTGIVGYHYFFFTSLHYTRVANTAIINGLSPIITGIMAALFIRERLSTTNWAGIIIAFAGVMILVTKGSASSITGMEFNRGDLLMLIAVVCWAVYSLIVKRIVEQYSALTITFISALFGVLALMFLVIPENLSDQVRTISTESILSVLYMGVIASGLGYLFYNLSIKQLGPTRTSGFVYSTVPLLTALLAFLFFSEPVTVTMLISAVLVIAGLQLALRQK